MKKQSSTLLTYTTPRLANKKQYLCIYPFGYFFNHVKRTFRHAYQSHNKSNKHETIINSAVVPYHSHSDLTRDSRWRHPGEPVRRGQQEPCGTSVSVLRLWSVLRHQNTQFENHWYRRATLATIAHQLSESANVMCKGHYNSLNLKTEQWRTLGILQMMLLTQWAIVSFCLKKKVTYF